MFIVLTLPTEGRFAYDFRVKHGVLERRRCEKGSLPGRIWSSKPPSELLVNNLVSQFRLLCQDKPATPLSSQCSPGLVQATQWLSQLNLVSQIEGFLKYNGDLHPLFCYLILLTSSLGDSQTTSIILSVLT